MRALGSIKRGLLLRLAIIIASPFILLIGSILLDQIPMRAARPPAQLITIEDFEIWKRKELIATATLEDQGIRYTVLLGPAGRYLASGPSAYLFDERGHFVDWTADMGDLATVKKRIYLNGGRLQNYKRENR